MRVIKLPYGNLKRLAERVSMSEGSVRDALAYKTDTDRACEVRGLAFKEFDAYEINRPTRVGKKND